MSKDSRLPAEFDVSSYVKSYPLEGGICHPAQTNLVEVLVARYSDGSYLEVSKLRGVRLGL